jgi:hypothetical protein
MLHLFLIINLIHKNIIFPIKKYIFYYYEESIKGTENRFSVNLIFLLKGVSLNDSWKKISI